MSQNPLITFYSSDDTFIVPECLQDHNFIFLTSDTSLNDDDIQVAITVPMIAFSAKANCNFTVETLKKVMSPILEILELSEAFITLNGFRDVLLQPPPPLTQIDICAYFNNEETNTFLELLNKDTLDTIKLRNAQISDLKKFSQFHNLRTIGCYSTITPIRDVPHHSVRNLYLPSSELVITSRQLATSFQNLPLQRLSVAKLTGDHEEFRRLPRSLTSLSLGTTPITSESAKYLPPLLHVLKTATTLSEDIKKNVPPFTKIYEGTSTIVDMSLSYELENISSSQ